MTHELEGDSGEVLIPWTELPNASEFAAQPIEGVPIGDMIPEVIEDGEFG